MHSVLSAIDIPIIVFLSAALICIIILFIIILSDDIIFPPDILLPDIIFPPDILLLDIMVPAARAGAVVRTGRAAKAATATAAVRRETVVERMVFSFATKCARPLLDFERRAKPTIRFQEER